jgi:hypothetical protein
MRKIRQKPSEKASYKYNSTGGLQQVFKFYFHTVTMGYKNKIIIR